MSRIMIIFILCLLNIGFANILSEYRLNFGITNSIQNWNYESDSDSWKSIENSVNSRIGLKIGLSYSRDIKNQLSVVLEANYTQKGSVMSTVV